ncbi:hypothetical protein B0H14DRAFT_2575907 [Mycena olivaceomarginata]|nr:hypothetical protein B0H14DRAFT_2575907 [Mycena olivaceomarginata]
MVNERLPSLLPMPSSPSGSPAPSPPTTSMRIPGRDSAGGIKRMLDNTDNGDDVERLADQIAFRRGRVRLCVLPEWRVRTLGGICMYEKQETKTEDIAIESCLIWFMRARGCQIGKYKVHGRMDGPRSATKGGGGSIAVVVGCSGHTLTITTHHELLSLTTIRSSAQRHRRILVLWPPPSHSSLLHMIPLPACEGSFLAFFDHSLSSSSDPFSGIQLTSRPIELDLTGIITTTSHPPLATFLTSLTQRSLLYPFFSPIPSLMGPGRKPAPFGSVGTFLVQCLALAKMW